MCCPTCCRGADFGDHSYCGVCDCNRRCSTNDEEEENPNPQLSTYYQLHGWKYRQQDDFHARGQKKEDKKEKAIEENKSTKEKKDNVNKGEEDAVQKDGNDGNKKEVADLEKGSTNE